MMSKYDVVTNKVTAELRELSFDFIGREVAVDVV